MTCGFRLKTSVRLWGEQIEHPIETFFESALFSLGKNTLSVGYTVNGVSKYKFIPILESFDIKDNFGTKKRTKRLYKVKVLFSCQYDL